MTSILSRCDNFKHLYPEVAFFYLVSVYAFCHDHFQLASEMCSWWLGAANLMISLTIMQIQLVLFLELLHLVQLSLSHICGIFSVAIFYGCSEVVSFYSPVLVLPLHLILVDFYSKYLDADNWVQPSSMTLRRRKWTCRTLAQENYPNWQWQCQHYLWLFDLCSSASQ